jgi:hypothetical protein
VPINESLALSKTTLEVGMEIDPGSLAAWVTVKSSMVPVELKFAADAWPALKTAKPETARLPKIGSRDLK